MKLNSKVVIETGTVQLIKCNFKRESLEKYIHH